MASVELGSRPASGGNTQQAEASQGVATKTGALFRRRGQGVASVNFRRPMLQLRVAACSAALFYLLAVTTKAHSAAVITGDVTPSFPWTSSSDVLIGDAASGTLAVDAGSTLNSRVAYLGYSSGATGTATISGNGSDWINSWGFVVGREGSGSLRIESGGHVSSVGLPARGHLGRSYLGFASGSNGEATVTGVGSQWTNTDNLYVGNSGNGTLRIESGGQVSDRLAYIGYASGATGDATVAGASSLWANYGNLYVGYEGSGMLRIEGGGQVNNQWAQIGSAYGSTGAAIVTGAGSRWINSEVHVGRAGNGSLHVDAGGQIETTYSLVGYSSSSTGAATITGVGSHWTSDEDFYLGLFGSGSLQVEAGGQVSNSASYIGYYLGSTGEATITGAGSRWTNRGDLHVGREGRGALTVSDGGRVTAETLYASLDHLHGDGSIAAAAGAVLDADLQFDAAHGTQVHFEFGSGGSLAVTAAGGDLGAGYKGQGSLTVADGVAVASDYGYLGYLSHSTGAATVSGAGSQWTNSGSLSVGRHGDGTLRVEESARVTSSRGYIGLSSTSTSNATITGVGSEWINDLTLTVGAYGSGALTVTGGAHVSDVAGYVGSSPGSMGEATVSGAGSQWTNSDSLDVGGRGKGLLSITHGGLVTVGRKLTVDEFSPFGDSVINMTAGGMLALSGDADDSLDQFLDLISGTDAIRYWDAAGGGWAPITTATYGDDYTLQYLANGELSGYTVLTVGTIPEPSAWMLLTLFSLALTCRSLRE